MDVSNSYRGGIILRLTQLEHFVSLVEHKNYSNASEASYVSRQAISNSVRSLGDELGLTLVELDDRNQPIITEPGLSVYLRAKDILNQVNALKSYALEQSVLNTPLKIAVSDTITPILFPACMTKLQELKLEKERNIGEISQVGNSILADHPTDYYDLAIFLGDRKAYKNYNVKVLKRFPAVLTIPYTNDLYEKSPLFLDDLANQTVIVPVPIYTDFLAKLSEKYGINFEPISNIYQAAHTAITKAWCILDAKFTTQDTDLIQREIQDFSYNLDVIAVWRKKQDTRVQGVITCL